MKKYVKPELYFESFVLNQNIADCAIEWTNNTDQNTCIAQGDPDLNFGFVTALFASVENCTFIASDLESYCNTNGVTANLFQS